LEDSWLNPDFATGQVVVLATIVLASLILLPVVFGALIYGLLSLYARLANWRLGMRREPDVEQEETHDQAPV
jgi:hypothetical protein